MKIIDISCPIYTGMWSYSDYYPDFELSSVKFEFGGEDYSIEVFKGMHAQTGTYIETPSVLSGIKKATKVIDIPLDKLFMIDAYIYKLNFSKLGFKDGLRFVSENDLKIAEKSRDVPKGLAILITSGYDKNYMKEDYAKKGWFFKKEAIYYLMDKKPLLIGSDSPDWENTINPEGFFKRFYKSGILLLAPLINLGKVKGYKAKLTVLPLKIANVAACPVRAILVEK